MPAIKGTKSLVWSNTFKRSLLEQTPKSRSLHQKVQRPCWDSLWGSYSTYIFLHAYQKKTLQYSFLYSTIHNAIKCKNVNMLIPVSLFNILKIWGILTSKIKKKKWIFTYFYLLELGRACTFWYRCPKGRSCPRGHKDWFHAAAIHVQSNRKRNHTFPES